MGIAVAHVRVEADLAHHLDHAPVALGLGQLLLVDGQAFLDDLGDGQPRAERAERILEDDLHLAPQRAHVVERASRHVLAGEADRPIAGDQPQDGETQRGLARAGFADDAERGAGPDRDGDVVDRLHVVDSLAQQAALDREIHLQMVGLDQHRQVIRLGRGPPTRRGRKQFPGIGMLGIGEQRLRRAALDDLAAGHDADPVGEFFDDAEVVGDHQDRHAHALLQVAQQRQDLGLDGDVERRGRLVGDQQVRLVGERHGDHHPLPLAAGQLVRIGLEPLGDVAEPDEVEQLDDAGAGLLAAHALVDRQHLADLALDRMQRVERGQRFLEHHGDAVAADRPQRLFVGANEFAPLEGDRARRMERRRIGQQLQHRQRADRLSRAGFAHQGQGLALADRERDAAHRLDDPVLGPEVHRQIGHLEQAHLRPPTVLRGSNASRTASPMKISRLSMRASTRKAEMPSHGAWRLFLPCYNSSPSEAEPGGRPKPRKSRAVSVVIEPLRMNGMKVRVATMALGSTCLTMIRPSPRPSARAART